MTTANKQGKAHIDDLHFEHQQWLRELRFYKEELDFFRARLEEIVVRYTSKEVMMDLEHFQNQFYIDGNVIDTLIHDINEHEHVLANYAEKHPVAIDHVLFDDHGPLRDRIERNRELMNEMKKEYLRFLAKWM